MEEKKDIIEGEVVMSSLEHALLKTEAGYFHLANFLRHNDNDEDFSLPEKLQKGTNVRLENEQLYIDGKLYDYKKMEKADACTYGQILKVRNSEYTTKHGSPTSSQMCYLTVKDELSNQESEIGFLADTPIDIKCVGKFCASVRTGDEVAVFGDFNEFVGIEYSINKHDPSVQKRLRAARYMLKGVGDDYLERPFDGLNKSRRSKSEVEREKEKRLQAMKKRAPQRAELLRTKWRSSSK